MNRCCIGLGGNLDDVESRFQLALDQLSEGGRIQPQATSSCYRTRPVGPQAGTEFLNAAAVLATDLSPAETLAELHRVERLGGRRRVIHWGPRTLDLDLLLFNDQIVSTPAVTVPHPAMWYRRFVLDPLAEIAGDEVHPVWGLTVRQLKQRLLQRPLILELDPSLATLVDLRKLAAEVGSQTCQFRIASANSPGPAGSPETDRIFARVGLSSTATSAADLSPEAGFRIGIPPNTAAQSLKDLLAAALG